MHHTAVGVRYVQWVTSHPITKAKLSYQHTWVKLVRMQWVQVEHPEENQEHDIGCN